MQVLSTFKAWLVKSPVRIVAAAIVGVIVLATFIDIIVKAVK